MAFAWSPPRASSRPTPTRPAGSAGIRRCPNAGCGGTEFVEYAASGDRACVQCGVVIEENNVVSSVQFSESGGASTVVGQFVSGDTGRVSGGGGNRARNRFGYNRDSRETTIQNGRKQIVQVRVMRYTSTSQAEEHLMDGRIPCKLYASKSTRVVS